MNFPDFYQILVKVGISIIPVLLGIICHEVAHGWVASRLGDPTAKTLGRLTLNPIKHLDPSGLMVFVVTAISPLPFTIGWAKPVPVQPRFFKNPRAGMMLVALAGPATNILLALGFTLIFRLLLGLLSPYEQMSLTTAILLTMSAIGVMVNCTLAVFNLMPVPPLDGGHIAAGLMPPALASKFWGLGKYGFLLVIILLATGIFGKIVWPIVSTMALTLCLLTGVSFTDLTNIAFQFS